MEKFLCDGVRWQLGHGGACGVVFLYTIRIVRSDVVPGKSV